MDHDKLVAFYAAVAHLTLNHNILYDKDGRDWAVVFPAKLGKELEKVDPEWWKTQANQPEQDDREGLTEV